MASIVIASGPAEGKYFTLGTRTTIVGRDASCDIQIVDDFISHQHLQVRYASDSREFLAADMRSTNGIVVNGQPVSGETILRDGDRIELGNSVLIFSTLEFPDRDSVLAFLKAPGQEDRSTMIQ